MITNEEIKAIQAMNEKTKEIKKKAKTRAQIQKDHRLKLKTLGLEQISIMLSIENKIALLKYMESKKTGQGQFSKAQKDNISQSINKALSNFFRKR